MKSFGKKLCITAALSFIFLFACGCSDAEGTNKHKPITGIDPCFEESLGYYNESPSVVRMGNIQYMFYTRNANINDNTSDTIAVRRGTVSGITVKRKPFFPSRTTDGTAARCFRQTS